MYARVRSYRIPEGQVDERLKHARETGVPAFKGQNGFAGVLVLVDQSSHKNMTIGLWETEAGMHASGRDERAMSQASHRRHAAGDVATEHFAVKERAGQVGRFAQARTYQVAPDRVEEGLRHAQENVEPHWKALPGYTGSMLLVDEAGHKNIALTFFDTEADMLASERNPEANAILAGRPHVAGPEAVEHFQVGHSE